MRKLYLVDSYIYKVDHLKYSWDSKKKHRHNPRMPNRPNIGDQVLKRIDRIYSSISVHRGNFQTSSTIMLGHCFSDHAHVVATIWVIGLVLRPSLYRMNTKDLEERVLKDKLESLWERLRDETLGDCEAATSAFFKGLYQSKRITRTHGKLKAKIRRRKEEAL